MSNQPPYNYPPPQPPPPGGYQGGGYPPPGGYQGGGYPPPPGPGGPGGKTQVLGLNYNTAAMLCYLPSCLCCIDLIASILFIATEPKESRFMRFHALQGLLLYGVGFLIGLVFYILSIVLHVGVAVGTGSGAAGQGAGALVSLLSWGVGLVLLVVHIIAAVKAYQGQMWKLPVIGDIAEKNS